MKYIFLLVPDTALGKVGRPWSQHFPFNGRCFIWYFMVTGYYLVRCYWLFMPGVSETSSQWSFDCHHGRDVGQCSRREHPHLTSGFGSGFWRLCIIPVVCHWRLKCVIQGASSYLWPWYWGQQMNGAERSTIKNSGDTSTFLVQK